MTAGTVLTIIGGALQLLGLCAAGFGVRRVRREHAQGRLGTRGHVKEWWCAALRFFKMRPPVAATATMAATAPAAAAAFSAAMVAAPPVDATAEQRERFLMDRVIQLQREMDGIRNTVARASSEQHVAITDVGSAIQGQAEQFRLSIDWAMADGLVLEALGLWLAAVGAVLTIIGAAVQGP
ncbi:hypothetical protein [Streptomyces sp. H39-S7]|uniref:hypothetical protein n=1 Tax=Streptomyces sp. H39-S7 TaxID=3004357 RepID=UPI0022B03FAA|nr:hypothetical protein [Streptomyces sp. H39-S7]MCZ4120276.1 hypothetical protein [Streptomyces sp. H39-S7]